MKKLFGVIGDPISHSMSPAMHNDLFAAYSLDAHYQAFHISRENLTDAIIGFRAMGIAGFNVTVPHKEAIIPLLDELDPLAEAIGAVNTVVNQTGKLIGYNTDGSGYVKGLLNQKQSIKDKKVLIVGAGGAARAIYFTIAKEGPELLDICNRTPKRAEQIINDCPFRVPARVLSRPDAEGSLETYDLIVQTTSIGMHPEIGQSPLSVHKLKPGAFVSDIIYNPLETKLLTEAAEKGAGIQNGIDMFVYQGALAFEMWTGIGPDIERMRHKVLNQLGGLSC
ncbi:MULTISPECIES: shikimate dehydrogenase [Cytobacillus]|uniref:Shikimate dehydrogenase (NADP(+)) n=2 Tax=Cytobacillus TaxID=2675230 RepID=A0ABX3CT39_9BACI|nr:MULTISPECIES: shikimate dehydrogenase [Cytobacillus]EFV77412.1 shikimate 5-dehydrogenase [Bacillus sp. 2_A_57_CT2]MBY0154422.1 shikimate dehydrogenase [Cytobacillus firmus]MCM3394045.1 shikimate dehydrogenase [Cytobacillus oceanisediminis]MCM3401489.1 shikimate dehydrogenase [Cytobacillus oceanisediminis]MCM3529803.1 shikimate dehydrogenase [Cytobacillus oceanisediminis]